MAPNLNLKKAGEVLKSGGVIMHATETCYGLAADIFNPRAVKKIYRIKKMPAGKPVSIMVRGIVEALKYAEFNPAALRLAKEYWPGPLTLVLPRKKSLPGFLNKNHFTVGIRCPDSKIAQALVRANGGPLITTSANISGKNEVYEVEDYLAQIKGRRTGNRPDLIIDSGPIGKNPPSTIIGFEDGSIKMMREGSLWVKILNKYVRKADRA